MFKKLLDKLKSKPKTTAAPTPSSAAKPAKAKAVKSSKKAYPNRFLKFYHENKSRVNKNRRSMYTEHRKAGLCVRCTKKSAPGIVFCSYHQQKQNKYNKIARS